MTTKLLDTTFLIHYWGGDPGVEEYLETHEETAEFAATTLNLKEVAVGRRLQGEFDRQELESTFNWVRLVPFDVEHAFLASGFEADLHRRENVNQDRVNALAGDLLIAAVAKALDAPVVTRNVDDFELFEGVDVETY